MNLREACRELGLYENALSYMKRNNPEKFEHIMALDDNPVAAYRKYKNNMNELAHELTHMYYALAEKRKLMELSRLLYRNGIFGSELSFINGIGGIVFTTFVDMNFRVFLRYTKVLEIYKEHKDEIFR